MTKKKGRLTKTATNTIKKQMQFRLNKHRRSKHPKVSFMMKKLAKKYFLLAFDSKGQRGLSGKGVAAFYNKLHTRWLTANEERQWISKAD